MSRRHEREGITQGDLQRLRNEQAWRSRQEHGVPDSVVYASFTVSDRFSALGIARNYGLRQWAWRDIESPARRAEEHRLARLHIDHARACDRPRLP